jgi:NTE family protein
MEVARFTDDARVVNDLDALRAEWARRRRSVSDIVDDAGNQYVDLVMEGGGVLGIALVGYTYALEEMGIRFLGVGGTSAGAINALLVAAVGEPGRPKSRRLLELLGNLPMFEFVDGDQDAKDFVRAIIESAGTVKLAWKAAQVIDALNEHLGLNPGKVFYDWLADALLEDGVASVADLERKLGRLPRGLRRRNGRRLTPEQAGATLALVAADVSTETKAVFPHMAPLYWAEPALVNPAHFVRASMSIPGFFRPYRVPNVPQGADAVRRWKTLAGYEAPLPQEAVFVDGGIMSNFPIDLFHVAGVPSAPTFGVKIGVERGARVITRPLQLLSAVFDAARHCADYDFILKHPDYSNLVATIDTGDHFWLDFFMEDDAKVDLFRRGVHAATGFLRGFDWKRYQEIRARLTDLPADLPSATARVTQPPPG